MTKTYKELQEAIVDSMSVVPAGMKPVGLSKDMDRYTLDHMHKFFQQCSESFQPELPKLMFNVETEFNKFGYTLGKLDLDDADDYDSGEEEFGIFTLATKELVENVYLCLDWERLESGQQQKARYDGAKLILSVKFDLEELEVGELRGMLGDLENNPLEPKNQKDNPDFDDATDKSIHDQK